MSEKGSLTLVASGHCCADCDEIIPPGEEFERTREFEAVVRRRYTPLDVAPDIEEWEEAEIVCAICACEEGRDENGDR